MGQFDSGIGQGNSLWEFANLALYARFWGKVARGGPYSTALRQISSDAAALRQISFTWERGTRVGSPRFVPRARLPFLSMPTVRLFVTCLVNGFFPEVAEAAVKVLERAGCSVVVPTSQTCCGQPAFNCGLVDDARKLGKKILDDFSDGDDPVVVPSGSCADMLINHLPHLFEDDPPAMTRAQAVAERVVEFTSFLVDRLGVTNVGAKCQRKVAYHPSCHGLRNLGLGQQARALLNRVEGLDQVEIERETECCGFGGLFAVELPEVSAAIMDQKLDRVEAASPEWLVGGDVSCLLHLEGGLRRRGSDIEVRHIAQVLATSQ